MKPYFRSGVARRCTTSFFEDVALLSKHVNFSLEVPILFFQRRKMSTSWKCLLTMISEFFAPMTPRYCLQSPGHEQSVLGFLTALHQLHGFQLELFRKGSYRFCHDLDPSLGILSSKGRVKSRWPSHRPARGTDAPTTKWVTDWTMIATQEGWLSLAVVLDLFARCGGG